MSSTAERLEHERRGTVLVVAGDELRVEIADSLLTAGYRVVTIGSTIDAVGFLRRQTVQPAMIVLDWSAPGMSGLQFIAFHSSSPVYSRTPVAVITQSLTNNVPRLCVVAVLSRPVDHDHLAEVVERATRTGSRHDTPEPGLELS